MCQVLKDLWIKWIRNSSLILLSNISTSKSIKNQSLKKWHFVKPLTYFSNLLFFLMFHIYPQVLNISRTWQKYLSISQYNVHSPKCGLSHRLFTVIDTYTEVVNKWRHMYLLSRYKICWSFDCSPLMRKMHYLTEFLINECSRRIEQV